jgi:hypothetical protein
VLVTIFKAAHLPVQSIFLLGFIRKQQWAKGGAALGMPRNVQQ